MRRVPFAKMKITQYIDTGNPAILEQLRNPYNPYKV